MIQHYSMKNIGLIVSILLFFTSLLIIGVIAEENSDITPEWKEGYYPTYPMDPSIKWVGNLTLEAGYPLVDHAFGPFTEKDWERYGVGKEHVIRILAYENPPLFPNDTVY